MSDKKEKKKEKNLSEINIDKIIVEVYNKIAEWHNDDGSSPGLKQLSFDVIKDVTDLVCEHFEVPFGGEIKIDENLKGEATGKEKDVK